MANELTEKTIIPLHTVLVFKNSIQLKRNEMAYALYSAFHVTA